MSKFLHRHLIMIGFIFLASFFGYGQSITITGTVTDADSGDALPGTSIVVKGSSNGTVTDFDGNYSIKIDNTTDILVFSFLGYFSLEESIGSRTEISLSMTPNSSELDQVVVIGYGTQNKKELTGSVTSISSNNFKAQPMINSTDALQGRASGVFVGSTNGAPGGSSKIVVRGANSISGSSSPLIVIDGILSGSLESVNPAEIASIEVLKDASSTAIFGSRGANGVIIVTTKTGTSTAPKVSFSSFYGTQSISKSISLLSAADFAREANAQDFAITGNGNIYSDQEINNLESSGGTNWQDELFRSAPTSNYQLSVSGKSKKTDYYFSGNYADQEGIIKNTGFKRYNARAKVNTQVSDKFKTGINLAVTRTQGRNNQTRAGLGSPVYGALAFDPTMPIYGDDGSYNLTSIKGVGTLGVNPLAQQLEFNLDRESTRISLNAYLNYEIIEGLTFNLMGGANITQSSDKRFNKALTGVSTAAIYNGDSRVHQLTSQLTYEKEIRDHKFKIDAIHEVQESKWNSNSISGTDMAYPSTTYNNIGTANNVVANSYAEERQLESFMGRFNYSFKSKYIITGAVRRDGSSVLAEGNKYNSYPSGALAWRISEESFFKDSNIFNEMKLRASYGLTGNQAVSPYQSLATLGTGALHNYPFDDAIAVIGAGPDRLANPSLKWEKTAQLDIGLDASLFNNRFGIVFDYYKKSSSDLLMLVPTAPYRGGLSYTANIGDIENTGFEIGVNGTIINNDNFNWNANFNIAFNETIVTDLGDNTEFFSGNKYGGGQAVAPAVILEEGEKTGNFYGFIYEGVWKSNEATEAAIFGNVPGDAKYKDINGDGTINNDDLDVMGNGQADFVWGFNNSFTFKSFDLNIFFQGVQGNEIWNLGRGYIFGGSGDARNATTSEIKNRWTPQNENTNIPGYSSTSSNIIQSSRYVEDGSFIRMKNISLGYNFPDSVVQSSKIFDSLRIYLSAQNLFTITDYSGFDPEITSTGNSSVDQSIDYGAYPTSKTVILGLNVTF